ncbi:MAG: BREX-3 system phosphatase PglZ [Desulfobacula sp.]|jgi:hypothetical protein|nr:BREX-3 system phosphatase PglZ [Desulfobacula sp.]
MNGWRETILKEFIPNVSKLTLVADPDSLLTKEKLFVKLRQRGFDLIEFDDPIEFRYAYESKYRSIWDRGEHTDLVVILRLQNSELLSLPYDLLQAGRKLSFNLGELFPNLSYPVIEELDRSMLDALFDAQQKTSSARMGDNATKDFILRHVYGIPMDMISDDIKLLRTLLRLHYSKTQMPKIFSERLVQILIENNTFGTWDLKEIVPNEEAFFAFLQERWPIFIDHLGKTDQIKEKPSEYGLKYRGPEFLPFDHQDIRIYIDNLFLEGKIAPVKSAKLNIDSNSWIKIGVKEDEDDNASRISGLFNILKKDFPTVEGSSYTKWINFALKWAELSALIHCTDNDAFQSQFCEMGFKLNKTFAIWLTENYSNLINLPPTNPTMLHHVSRRIARDMEKSKNNLAALIVVDGLALDQWVSIRQILQDNDSSLIIKESAVFAWIPTLTSVSRQSIFSGKPPFYFPSSIKTTNNEEKLWKQFWENNNVSRLDIAYARGLSDGNVENIMDSIIHPGKTKAVGLVIDKIDKIMHGMQLGSAGMHNQIKQWCRKGFLQSLINYLLNQGYDVWMTSDHGNIECSGKGRPTEGVIAETKGERVRIYPSEELRSQVAADFPFAQKWHPVGLPSDYYPLIAGDQDAFINKGNTIVGHGGISIEEVIVPLVNFKRNTR